MAIRYQDISYGNFGGGIDALSPESKIPDEFVEMLQNMDPTPNGSLIKRTGTQLYGSIPVRVKRMESIDGVRQQICFFLDNSVNVLELRSTPIYVYGRTSEPHASQDFTNVDGGQYYEGFVTDIRTAVEPNLVPPLVPETITLEGTTHGQGELLAIMATRSTSLDSLANEQFLATDYVVTKSTDDIQVTLTNASYMPGESPESIDVFLVAKSLAPIPGLHYVETTSVVAVGTTSVSIPAGTHNLNNYNILAEYYLDTGTTLERVFPDSWSVGATGTVSASFIIQDASLSLPATIYSLLRCVEAVDTHVETLGINTHEYSYPIPTPDTYFPFVQVFEDVGGGVKQAVLCESVQSSSSTINNQLVIAASVSVHKIQEVAKTFTYMWDFGTLISNKLCVDAHSTTTDYQDENPQVTVWGLPHKQLYASADGATPGYVTHLDTYRAQAEERAVAGLGGNLFAAYSYAELAGTYGMSIYYPNLRGRLDASAKVGPAFINQTGTSARTSGYIKFDTAASNLGKVISATHIPNTTTVTYRISTPNREIQGSVSTICSTKQYLTVSNMGHSINNGEFRITGASASVTTGAAAYLDITVSNPNVTNYDWNESDCYGLAGIFTDQVTLSDLVEFQAGDRLLSSAWGEEQYLSVTDQSSGNTLNFSGLYEEIELPDGSLLVGRRTSRLLPLRNLAGDPTTTNLVAGDVLSYSQIDRELRVKYVIARANESVSIANNVGSSQRVYVQVANSNLFSVGQSLLFYNAGQFSGVQVVKSIVNPTRIELEVEATTGSISCSIIGHMVEVDEELEWEDSLTGVTYLNQARRWLPIEAPVSGFSQPLTNYYRYFNARDYDNQAYLRSAMVNDTMYFTDGVNPVQRYDGQNITRSGFFRWQMNAYLTVDTSRPTIVVNTNGVTADSDFKGITTNQIKVKKGMELLFTKGDTVRFRYTYNGQTSTLEYTVSKITDDGTDGIVELDLNGVALPSSDLYASMTAKSLKKIAIFSYYYRLNLLDINDNVIASAVVGSQDARVSLDSSATIHHLLIRPPFLDNFDFSRIELQVYRTKQGSTSPYYLVGTVNPEWNGGQQAYLQFSDTESDNSLLDSERDATTSVLLNKELGTTWTGPLRSKYVTSAANSLILGNFKTWPTLAIQPSRKATTPYVSPMDLNGKRILLRKSNLDTLTTTDDLTRMGFEFRANSKVSITPSNAGLDTLNATLEITAPTAHGLSVGNWVYLFHYHAQFNIHDPVNPRLGGHYQVYSVTNSTHFKVKLSSTLVSDLGAHPINGYDVNSYITATTKTDIPVWLGIDELYGTLAGNLSRTLSGRINIGINSTTVNTYTGYTTSELEVGDYVVAAGIPAGTTITAIVSSTQFTISQAATTNTNNLIVEYVGPISVESFAFLRLATAINSAQAACRTSGFTPWVVANAGGEYAQNQLVLEVPYVTDDVLEAVIPSVSELDFYANGLLLSGETQVQARTQLFPSRLLLSYPKYAELFDSPTNPIDSFSDSAIDINPADGQEITGIIPFFGESAFGAAQKDGILLVFKTASVYLVNLAAKRAGQACVQRLDTRGNGCQAPYSIAPTQNGIMFANRSGIYRITTGLECQYIGRKLSRIWEEQVDRQEVDTQLFGHYYPLGGQYKLSVPYAEDGLNYPNRTFVYNTTREYTADGYRDGSWTTYSNIPAIGWANMLDRALFATPHGEVFTLRMTGEASDFRDDAEPIEAVATLRALDFGTSASRKAIGTFTVQFRPGVEDSTATVESAINLIDNWEVLDPVVISRRVRGANMGNVATQQLNIVQYASNKRKGVFYQLRISNSEYDQNLQVSGVSVSVAGIGSEGITQARETSR